MSSDKFSSKSKEDLILIASLGQVLTPEKAKKMTKKQLVDFLRSAEEGSSEPSVKKDEPAKKETVKKKEPVKKEEPKAKPGRSRAKALKEPEVKPESKPEKTTASAKRGRKPKADPKTAVKTKPEVEADVKPEEKKTESTDTTSRGRRKKIAGAGELSVSVEKLPEPIKEHLAETVKENKEEIKKSEDSKSDKDQKVLKENNNNKDNKEHREHREHREHKDPKEAAHGESGHVEMTEMIEGVLEVMADGYGFLRKENYLQSPRDIYVAPQYIRRFNLRTGDKVIGPGKPQKESDRYQALLYIKEVNGQSPEKMMRRPSFDRLTPIYPDEKFILETSRNELSTRIIDLIAPIGKGQRGMIVSPPKAGKTILLQKIANAIATNNPGTKLIVLLIDERPEEVTDMQRSIKGEVVYSTFDKTPENHVKIVELVLERAMRLVELGEDVVILLDSITRLGRAYNLTINPTGRTLSGGLDPGALYGPKRFFGAARNIENGGSLTIIATSLIDTGSRMDEVIFEEFKGTGNMEVYLDRKLSEKRIFPAIDINRSGTRREELLLTQRELDAVWTIRKAFGQLDTAAVTEMIISLLLKTSNNPQFVSSVNVSMNDKSLFEAMRGNRPGNSGSGNNGNNSGNGYY